MKKMNKKRLLVGLLFSSFIPFTMVQAEEGTPEKDSVVDSSEVIDTSQAIEEDSQPVSQLVLRDVEASYEAVVKEPFTIATLPWGTEGSELVLEGNEILGETVQVTREITTEKSTYALLTYKEKEIGWIDKAGLLILSEEVPQVEFEQDTKEIEKTGEEEEKEATLSTFSIQSSNSKEADKTETNEPVYTIQSTTDHNYIAKIVKPWSINTEPWGVEGYETIPNYTSYLGDTVDVTQEKVTERATYALLSQEGKTLGWIDKGALEVNEVLQTKQVEYTVEVTKPWSINSQPWGTDGYQFVRSAATLIGETFNVKQEKVTNRSTYVLLEKDGKNIGWIDVTGVQKNDEIISTKTVNYAAQIVKPWSINTEPWGTTDSKPIPNYGSYLRDTVDVIQEKVTERSTYALIKQNGKVLGWIDKTGLEVHEVLSTKDVSYVAIISQPWSINTQPWGINGYEAIPEYQSYLGDAVDVIQEKTTQRSTYALLSQNGKTLGWIDKGALEVHEILSTKDVMYTVKVTKPWSINSEPWGTNGYKFVQSASSLIGETFNIKQEKVTNRSTYVLLEKNGKEIGWIDHTGVEKNNEILSMKDVNYVAIISKPWSINTQPWGTTGFKPIPNYASYLNEAVDVVQEKVTDRSTYALIKLNGKTLGWIDKTGLEVLTVKSTKNTQYVAKVDKPWSINTQPWGVNGYEPISNSRQYLDKTVDVIQEKVTQRSTYSLIQYNGKTIGWIDKGALDYLKVSSTKNVSYTVEITKPWAITTQPWGTEGYEHIQSASSMIGQMFNVSQEKVTQRSTYILLEKNGKKVGWFDNRGTVKNDDILSVKKTSYAAEIVKPWSINTEPWGTKGYKKAVDVEPYLGETVEIIQEKVTNRSTYSLIKHGNKVLGWIDKTGLSVHKVLSTKNVSYTAEMVRPWSINTQPWGIEGFERIANNSSYVGKTLKVTQEKATRRSTYALVAFGGKTLGWVDKDALDLNRTVFLDPGHGGKDSGAIGRLNGKEYYEKDLNLSVSLKVRDLLKKQGYNVIMSRQDDTYYTMLERSKMANNSGADIFFSVHFNAINSSSVTGIETIYYISSSNYPPAINQEMHNDPERLAESYKLAHSVQDAVINASGAHYRRVFGGAYAVLRETKLPAALVELGFMTNPLDLSKALTNEYQNILARGVVQGINNYYK